MGEREIANGFSFLPSASLHLHTSWPEKVMVVRDSYSLERLVWVVTLGKPLGPADVVAEDKRNQANRDGRRQRC